MSWIHWLSRNQLRLNLIIRNIRSETIDEEKGSLSNHQNYKIMLWVYAFNCNTVHLNPRYIEKEEKDCCQQSITDTEKESITCTDMERPCILFMLPNIWEASKETKLSKLKFWWTVGWIFWIEQIAQNLGLFKHIRLN